MNVYTSSIVLQSLAFRKRAVFEGQTCCFAQTKADCSTMIQCSAGYECEISACECTRSMEFKNHCTTTVISCATVEGDVGESERVIEQFIHHCSAGAILCDGSEG